MWRPTNIDALENQFKQNRKYDVCIVIFNLINRDQIDCLAMDCGNTIANTLELPHSWTKSLK